MGPTIGNDGLTDEDRDLDFSGRSDRECEGCCDPVLFGEPCILLRLVYPQRQGNEIILPDALEANGQEYMADPLIYCESCWDGYAEELRAHRDELFINGQQALHPSPLHCTYCQSPIGWGNCVAYAAYGELDISPRTQETRFVTHCDLPERAELLCLHCLDSLNAICDETIWSHLWEEA